MDREADDEIFKQEVRRNRYGNEKDEREQFRVTSYIGYIDGCCATCKQLLRWLRIFVGGGVKIINNIFYGFSICAVDIFLMISGYFLINNNNRTLGKPLNLLFLCVFYKFPFVLHSFIAKDDSPIWGLLFGLLPGSYFINIYCVLYLLSPYINKMLQGNKAYNTRLLMMALIIFSLWPTLINLPLCFTDKEVMGVYPVGLSGTDRGFTFVNFTLCYIIGAYIRRYGVPLFTNQRWRIAGIIAIIALTTILTAIFPKLRSTHGLDGYDCIFVLALAVLVFLVFKDLKIGSVKVINTLSKATFTVYLLHEIVLRLITKRYSTADIFTSPIPAYLVKYAILLLVTYGAGVLAFFVLRYVFSPIISIWQRSRLYNMVTYTDK